MTVLNKLLRDDNIAITVFTTGIITSGYYLGKNTVMMRWFTKWYQKYKPDDKKEPVPVKNVLTFQFNAVLDDMNASKWDREFYKIFIAKKVTEPFVMGSIKMRQGVTIGVPEYFQHASDEGIISTNILINGKPIDWSSEDGQKLLQTFKLSNEAQRYILAKCVYLTDSYYYLIQAVLPMFVMVAAYSVAFRLYNKLKLGARSDVYALLLYSCVILVFGLLYLFLADGIYLQYDSATEESISELGQSYIIGSLHYNRKLVERNQILRKLVTNGYQRYLASGDRLLSLKPIGLPPSVRVAIAEERLHIKKGNEEMMQPPPVNPNPHPIL